MLSIWRNNYSIRPCWIRCYLSSLITHPLIFARFYVTWCKSSDSYHAITPAFGDIFPPTNVQFSDNLSASSVVSLYEAYAHDDKAAILVFQNNETAAMLVYQTNQIRPWAVLKGIHLLGKTYLSLEYGSTAWNPYRKYQKNWLEQVQRRAARFATKTYARLTSMYKTLHGQAAINIPPHVKLKTVMKIRNSDPMKFIPIQTSCDEYKYSFWPSKINDWNSLPPNIISMTSPSTFKVAVNNYLSA